MPLEGEDTGSRNRGGRGGSCRKQLWMLTVGGSTLSLVLSDMYLFCALREELDLAGAARKELALATCSGVEGFSVPRSPSNFMSGFPGH